MRIEVCQSLLYFYSAVFFFLQKRYFWDVREEVADFPASFFAAFFVYKRNCQLANFFLIQWRINLQKSSAWMYAEDNATTLFVIVLRITVRPPACVASTATKCCWKSQSLTPFLRGRSGCEIGVLQTNTTKRGCAVLPQEWVRLNADARGKQAFGLAFEERIGATQFDVLFAFKASP